MNLFRSVMTLLLLTGVLNGCAALVIGGAAAGGYYVAKDERSVGDITDDATITSTINTRFVRDDLVSAIDINVDTYEGVVTLTGTVDSPAASVRAMQLARSTKGVKRVNSKLTVKH